MGRGYPCALLGSPPALTPHTPEAVPPLTPFPSLCPLKFTLGRRAHRRLAMGTELPCTAGMMAACCHWGFAFAPQVCTPTHSPITHQGDFATPSQAKNMAKSILLWQEAKSQGRARDRGGSRLQDARALFSDGQANNPVLNYKPGFSCGCFVFVGFFVSCLFRFISVIPDTALSDIITIISLLCLPGNWEDSRGGCRAGEWWGLGCLQGTAPGPLTPELGTLGKVEAQDKPPQQDPKVKETKLTLREKGFSLQPGRSPSLQQPQREEETPQEKERGHTEKPGGCGQIGNEQPLFWH